MITPTQATAELLRMKRLNFFPDPDKDKSYFKELRLALECALTVEIAAQVVGDWLREALEAPKPAQLRAMTWELNEKSETRRSKCIICQGEGQVTRWVLVTYNGRSLAVKKQEILRDFNDELAQELGAKLRWDDGPITEANPFRGDNQQIVTGAKPCACRNSA